MSGAPARLVGSHGGHREWHDQHPLTPLLRGSERLIAARCRSRRIAGMQRSLGEAPQRRQHQVEALRAAAVLEGGQQVLLGLATTTSSGLDVPERPLRHVPAGARAGIAQRVAALSKRVIPAAFRPRHEGVAGAEAVAARRLLDGFRVPEALGDPGACLTVVHGPHREQGDIAIQADAGVFLAGRARRIAMRANGCEALGHASVDRHRASRGRW